MGPLWLYLWPPCPRDPSPPFPLKSSSCPHGWLPLVFPNISNWTTTADSFFLSLPKISLFYKFNFGCLCPGWVDDTLSCGRRRFSKCLNLHCWSNWQDWPHHRFPNSTPISCLSPYSSQLPQFSPNCQIFSSP